MIIIKQIRIKVLLVLLLFILVSCKKAGSIEETERITTEEADIITINKNETTVMNKNSKTAGSVESETDISRVDEINVNEPTTPDYLASLEKTLDSGYLLENSDSTFLQEEDINNFSSEKLKLARNEIFARHGKVFNDKILQSYFFTRSWYHEENNGDIELNEYENWNCELINKREEQLSNGKVMTMESEGWVFIERINNKYSYQDMEIDLSQTIYNEFQCPSYLVRYGKKEYRIESYMQSFYKIAARMLENDTVMILITGEDDADCVYSDGYVISTKGITNVEGGGAIASCVDDYVCFWYGGFTNLGSDYYEWNRITSDGTRTQCMGAFCIEKSRTIDVPLEVNTISETEYGKKILKAGEKIQLISQLRDKQIHKADEEKTFLVLQCESSGERFWVYLINYDCKDGLTFREHCVQDESWPLGGIGLVSNLRRLYNLE